MSPFNQDKKKRNGFNQNQSQSQGMVTGGCGIGADFETFKIVHIYSRNSTYPVRYGDIVCTSTSLDTHTCMYTYIVICMCMCM